MVDDLVTLAVRDIFPYMLMPNYCHVRLADKPWLKVPLTDLL